MTPAGSIKGGIAFLTAAALMLWVQVAAAEGSQCVKCHTSSGKLIKITRSLATDKPIEKVKSKGPG